MAQKFQSTLPRRERLAPFSAFLCHLLFQSTLPRRERHSNVNLYADFLNFNPRSREGSDMYI